MDERLKIVGDAIDKALDCAESEIASLRAENERYKTVMRRCIKAMEGSNCLELQWLEQALKGEAG